MCHSKFLACPISLLGQSGLVFLSSAYPDPFVFLDHCIPIIVLDEVYLCASKLGPALLFLSLTLYFVDSPDAHLGQRYTI